MDDDTKWDGKKLGMKLMLHKQRYTKDWSETLSKKITWRHVCGWHMRWIVEIGICKDVNWIKLTQI